MDGVSFGLTVEECEPGEIDGGEFRGVLQPAKGAFLQFMIVRYYTLEIKVSEFECSLFKSDVDLMSL